MNLVITAIIGVVLVGQPDVKATRHQIDKRDDNNPSEKAPPATLPQQTGGQTVAADPSKKQQQRSPEVVRVVTMPDKGWSDWIIFAGNILLVIVGAGGVVVAVCTLRHIESQTVAIKKQADHMVESERPFLMIEVHGDENHASFKVCNHGKSPAKILFMDRLLSPTYLPIGDKLPPSPDYGQQYRQAVDFTVNAEPVNAEWVSHNGHTFIGNVSPKSELATFRNSLSPQNMIGPSVVWQFGAIVYKGLFGDTHYESRYCYRLLDNQWRMLGPHGYNEYK